MTTQKAPEPTRLTLDAPHALPSFPSSSSDPLAFLPVLAFPAQFSLDHFTQGLLELVLQPELSSSTILRADVLVDEDYSLSSSSSSSSSAAAIPQLDGSTPTRRIRRRILPARPQFDTAMEQECVFYERLIGGAGEHGEEEEKEGLLLLLPDFEQQKKEDPPLGRLPYYHPQVYALAFRFLPPSLSYLSSLSPSPASPEPPLPPAATLRLDLIPLLPLPPRTSTPLPLPSSSLAPLSEKDRLFRTALVLLSFAAKLCTGKKTGWEKRVHHDLLVGKEEVQDLYQVLKERYKWLLNEWKEGTDPEKHVFEDVAIAAWLMCLWRRTYPENGGKPPGGFVDIGCGNGLLVYLLHAEGYPGFGFDLRARKSWSHYSPSPDLRVLSLDPVSLLSSHLSSSSPSSPSPTSPDSPPQDPWPFPPNSFLIGNHADEMTPWLPLLAFATAGQKVGFLNIPCCLHEHVGRFERQNYTIPEEFLGSLPCPPPTHTPSSSSPSSSSATHPLLIPFYAPSPPVSPPSSSSSPSASATATGGRYHAYQLYLAHLTLLCGFLPEREALRIPSTKNFGMVGRRRVWDGESVNGEERERLKARAEEEVRRLVSEVERRGEWKARKPEGKVGEH